jgi:hypothetical protein
MGRHYIRGIGARERFETWLNGDGIVARNGITIDRQAAAALYDFVKRLPLDVRIASRPADGDDIPW